MAQFISLLSFIFMPRKKTRYARDKLGTPGDSIHLARSAIHPWHYYPNLFYRPWRPRLRTHLILSPKRDLLCRFPVSIASPAPQLHRAGTQGKMVEKGPFTSEARLRFAKRDWVFAKRDWGLRSEFFLVGIISKLSTILRADTVWKMVEKEPCTNSLMSKSSDVLKMILHAYFLIQ